MTSNHWIEVPHPWAAAQYSNAPVQWQSLPPSQPNIQPTSYPPGIAIPTFNNTPIVSPGTTGQYSNTIPPCYRAPTDFGHLGTSILCQPQKLDKHSPDYQSIKALFDTAWHHPGKVGHIRSIFIAKGYSLGAYGEQFRFHGTPRSCRFGNRFFRRKPCTKVECKLCGIVRNGFKLPHYPTNTPGMFGRGIYTTTVSSKADIYAKNHRMRSHLHAMLFCAVISRCPERLYAADHGRTAPSVGYDSVEAVLRVNGGAVDYPETVVYSTEKILPIGLIIYTRKGWSG